MSPFTAAGNPDIERVISSHMERIVQVVRAGMEPEAILLRGSFGKGEGDVLIEDGHLNFLSDYEINVATYSFRHRGYFNRMAEKLTEELGVQTSIVWMRPDYFYKLRVGPFVAGPVPVTISLYETRYGSRVIYGRDLLEAAPAINPNCIRMESGLQLMLNRMAEAIHYLPEPDGSPLNEWQSIYWINKLILACVESLLLYWGQYHYSYRERGRRFSMLADKQISFMGDEAQSLCQLGQRATEFKMRPRRELYPESLQDLTRQVVTICGRVFSYLALQEWEVTIDDPYTPYPEQYLQVQVDRLGSFSYQRALYKLLDTYKYRRTRRLPLNLMSANTAGEVVYSVVPLLFMGWCQREEALWSLTKNARQQLRKVCILPAPKRDARAEWPQLCEQVLALW